ncbi:MAG: rubrerythrin family protein [Syntrophotalea acetylenica]|uniref:Rubrerythrin n=1 Tax=Syntrophotalea acetylenica TaxID=29542 RepID=A0A1L3GK04_SYNAC|nr:rubrerythrin family protein [Syntrophotalea acetylenica]APG26220.1 rubrerythrin [Syntrophotalea acetylenica]APG42726.1 rubrerythrin [Syntrophotalea acetylenica]MDD4457082.1 rubrerythrin family protein [Syntrophotalea acetylenica]MDY0262163.1 rubrerythrin family protein [Syntrophotalea acetylenica]
MSDLQGTKTEQDLLEAFAGESQANRKYLAFAEQADKEGYPQVAKLFRAAAAAETVHAHAHLRALDGIKSTLENLKEAVGGETHEFKEMYPPMIKEAAAKGFKAAERTFSYANEVEKVHAGLYEKALADLGQNVTCDYWVCKVCGNTLEAEPQDPCTVCKAGKVAFFKID